MEFWERYREETEEAKARERALDAKVRAARRAFERLNSETPNEARDEQGWTPELVAAADRLSRASIEQGEHWGHEAERVRAAFAKADEA
jgi:hypothetical protein